MHSLTLEWTVDGVTHSRTLNADQSVSIGRRPDCDIPLNAPTVSRQHAAVSAEHGVFMVRNLSQTNAVHLNDHERLAPNQQHALHQGDTFRVGPVYFRVVAVTNPPAPVLKILCATCGRKVDYNPEDYCPWCGTALSAGSTVISSSE